MQCALTFFTTTALFALPAIGQQSKRLSAAIGPADHAKYAAIRDAKDWKRSPRANSGSKAAKHPIRAIAETTLEQLA